MAPEIMNENGYESFYPDLWSLGVLLYAMLYGAVPFKANNMEELQMLIRHGEFDFPREASEEAKSLISGLIVVDPKMRLTLPEVLNHPWLKEICEESESSDNDQENENSQNKVEKEQTRRAESKLNQTVDDESNFKDIGANINYVNVDNLFFEEDYSTKLSYTDY